MFEATEVVECEVVVSSSHLSLPWKVVKEVSRISLLPVSRSAQQTVFCELDVVDLNVALKGLNSSAALEMP